MTNNYLDRSNYLKGLLLLCGKDKKITNAEREFLLRVGKTLSFDQKFTETAIKELLINEHINNDPPLFSQKDYAEAFLRDAITLAFIDEDFNREEFDWILEIAEKNNIANEWLREEITQRICNRYHDDKIPLELEKFFNKISA